MAGDTRDPSPSSSSSSVSPKTYETFTTPPSANALPDGAGRNTAGHHVEVLSLGAAIRTVRIEDFKQVYMYPCARDSFLIGMGGAFGVGGVRAVLGAPIFTACTWAVGTFCFAGIGSYEYCQMKRRIEKMHMKRAVEIMDRKKAEREKQMQYLLEAKRRAQEEADRERAGMRWWKFW